MNPEISIIVPCYNQAQFLDECLETVLDQNYENWECIIVNDGSPDNTEEIAKKWIEKDPRFQYIYKENGGLSSARNAGIEISKGTWILPLDADDKISSRYLDLAAKEFNKGYTIIYCEAEKFGSENGSWELPAYSRKMLAVKNMIFCSAFFKREDWMKAGGYDTNLIYGWEDWDFWISLLKEKGNVFKIKEVGFYYRIKEISMIKEMSANGNSKKLYTHNIIYRKHIEFFTKELGSFENLFEANEKLTSENKHLKAILNSKRYVLVSKVFKFFKL
ncbi:glycosyltransferase family A protein [Chryseobacterium sp. Chry.R1]|uniref:glycosyltransferase family 2 protein n=1 Tax=unclassified Chryseobacterium TaxID=2593645 RepID=UPI0015550ADE|nr:glycosyltransferase family A protein [Chryseobacterium sp. LAM-KRS1]WBV55544.1 glycosyltransferase family A protein [Chryseobacterium daecheongense]